MKKGYSVKIQYIETAASQKPKKIDAKLHIQNTQVKFSHEDGHIRTYPRNCFEAFQKPTADSLQLVFKMGDIKAVLVVGPMTTLKEIYEKLTTTVTSKAKVPSVKIALPANEEVKTWINALESLPEHPEILSHKALMFYFLYLGASKGKPHTLTKGAKTSLMNRCQKMVSKIYDSPCGKKQVKFMHYISKNMNIEEKAATAEKSNNSLHVDRRSQKRAIQFPDTYNPLENPADITLGGDRGGYSNRDVLDREAEQAAQEIHHSIDDSYEDSDLGQLDLGIPMEQYQGISEQFVQDVMQDQNVFQEQTPAMVFRKRPQPQIAPKKKICMEEEHLNLSESFSSDDDDDDDDADPTVRQRTLSSSFSDDDDIPVGKQTAKRQAPLPPLPGQPSNKRQKYVESTGSHNIPETEHAQETERHSSESDTADINVDTASEASPDAMQQTVEKNGAAVDFGEFTDRHEAEMEADPLEESTALLSGAVIVGDQSSGDVGGRAPVGETTESNSGGEMDTGEKLVALLENPFPGTGLKYRNLVDKVEAAIENSFFMLLGLPNRDALAMEIGRSLKEGFQPFFDELESVDFPPDVGFGPLIMDLFVLYDKYFEPCEVGTKICLAGCLQDGEVEELPDAAAVEEHVQKSTHLARIRRKLVHEPGFVEKKAKLKKTQRKLLDAYDVMRDVTFPVGPGNVQRFIENLNLPIGTILQVIDLLPMRVALNSSQLFQPLTFYCSACGKQVESKEMHIMTPEHIVNANRIDLEADQDRLRIPPPKTPTPAVKKEEPVDIEDRDRRIPDVIDLTGDENESGITEPSVALD